MLVVAWLLSSVAHGAAEAKKFNVLFLMSDDLRPELGAYGVAGIRTPHIDALATQSIRFDRAYCQVPLCNPSRTSLLTGRYPTQTGVLDNRQWWGREHPDWITLPQWFREQGYVTMRVGKIFHGGIDDAEAWNEGGQPRRYPDDFAEGIDVAAGMPPGMTEPRVASERNPGSDRIVVLEGDGSSYGDYRHATRTIDFLRRHKDDDQPFFVACGFTNPHSPPRAPQASYDHYRAEDMTLPVDFAPRPTVPPGFPELAVVPGNRDLFMARDASEAEAREMIRAYWAATTFMDEQVGRVMQALDELGLRENTIVVFWGDHGYHLGEKGRWSKTYSLFEIATRVPLLISIPGSPANGTACARTVETVSLYRTLSELCGLPVPAGVEGASLVPLLEDPDAPWPHPAYSVVVYRDALGRSVRTERWRYTQWNEGERGEVLFDESADPHEMINLANNPQYAAQLGEMRNLLRDLPGRTR